MQPKPCQRRVCSHICCQGKHLICSVVCVCTHIELQHVQRPERRLVAQDTLRICYVVAEDVGLEHAQLRRCPQQCLQIFDAAGSWAVNGRRADVQLLQRRRIRGKDAEQLCVNNTPVVRQAQRAQLSASPRSHCAKQRLRAQPAVHARQVQLQPRGVVRQRRTPAAADLDAAQALLHRQVAEDGEHERVRQRRERVAASRRGCGALRRHAAAQLRP